MKLTTHIRNVLFLRKEKEYNKELDYHRLIKVTKIEYKKKGSWVRNKVAQMMRWYRKENPYKVQDYSEAKLLFETQPQGIDYSKIKVGQYITKFTEKYAVKGERWCEYYEMGRGGLGVAKVGEHNDRYDWWSLSTVGDEYFGTIDKDEVLMFRFATKEEVEEFKRRQKEFKQKTKEIKQKQKEVEALYKERGKI